MTAKLKIEKLNIENWQPREFSIFNFQFSIPPTEEVAK